MREWNIFYTFARMKDCIKKSKILCCAIIGIMSAAVASCGDKPKSGDIIVKKQTKVVRKQTQEMSPYEQKRNVQWLGATYKVCIERKADRSLAQAVDEQGNKYYDNRITVRILRGESLRFAASVGSPDRMSDEYDPLVVSISRTGGTAISKDEKLDTTSDETEEED